MYNTPPVFAIYVLMLVTRWLKDEVGGLEQQLERNREKSSLLYDAIDGSDGFYRGHAEPGSRSLMNVTWRLPSEDLERRFVEEAAARGLVELKGHRSVGGIRASLYNAMPLAGAQALADYMRRFAAHGPPCRVARCRPPAAPRGQVRHRSAPMGPVHDRPSHRNRSPRERGDARRPQARVRPLVGPSSSGTPRRRQIGRMAGPLGRHHRGPHATEA